MALLQRILPIKALQLKIVKANPFLNAMKQADFVGDIRGGDSFSDIYGLKRLIIGSMPDMIALLLKKKLILLPQTYGPYNSRIGKYIARMILVNADYVCSRDRDSIEVIQNLTESKVLKNDLKISPDVAFMLDAIKPDNVDIQPPIDPNLEVPLIGLNVNGLLYSGGYTKRNMFGLKFDYKVFIKELLSELLKNTEAHILFVPHTFMPEGDVNSDPEASVKVIQSLSKEYQKRVHLVRRKYDQSRIKGIIGSCDFFIGSRMHACIAALSQGIPTIGVAYSKKFLGVFASVGAGDMVIDARKMNLDETVDEIIKIYNMRNQLSADTQNKMVNVQKRVMDTFKELLA